MGSTCLDNIVSNAPVCFGVKELLRKLLSCCSVARIGVTNCLCSADCMVVMKIAQSFYCNQA